MIVLASDHRGYLLKEEIKKYLKEKNVEFCDVGTNSEISTDFPLFAQKGALKVLENEENIGIFICHSGNGMVMACNRFKGIRGALCSQLKWVKLARRDDLANVLVIPSGIVKKEKAFKLIEEFIKTPYGEGKYLRRAKMLDEF